MANTVANTNRKKPERGRDLPNELRVLVKQVSDLRQQAKTATLTTDQKTFIKTASFRILATQRVHRLLKGFISLKKLHSPMYKSTDEQREKIINIATEALTDLSNCYRGVRIAQTCFQL